MAIEYDRKEVYSAGEGKFVREQLPTQSLDEVSYANLTGKVSGASGTAEVVAGTADQRAIITNYAVTSGTSTTSDVWFELDVAGNTVRNDLRNTAGNDSFSASFTDGGLGVIPAGSAVTVNAYPAGTLDVASNLRIVPLE